MKRILSLSVVLVFSIVLVAQANYKRLDNKMLDEANLMFDVEEYKEALMVYKKLYPLDTSYTDVVYKLGMTLLKMKQAAPAIQYLEQAAGQGHTEAHFELAQLYHEQHQFDEAIARYNDYKELFYRRTDDQEVDRLIRTSSNAKAMLANMADMEIENLGPRVNSKYQDYVPFVTADGSELYFTSRRPGSVGGMRDHEGKYMEDIYVSQLKSGRWGTAKNIGGPVNSETHDATVGIAPNGNALLIYRTSSDMKSGDLYITENHENVWSNPKKLGKNINSEHQEASACISGDENVMYFSSDRPGGYGGRDLYRVKKLPNGEWSLPLNLGPMINTAFDEDAPFVHSDGKTFFFASKGHNTIGGYDIFKSTLIGQDLWTVPENLGGPINTVKDDIYFALSVDGSEGYFSSERPDGYGEQDIYKVTFPNPDLNYAVIRGTVTNKDGVPMRSSITMFDGNGDLHGQYTTNARTGGFIMIVDPGMAYNMLVEKAGFKDISQIVKHSPDKKENELSVIIKMTSSKEQFSQHE